MPNSKTRTNHNAIAALAERLLGVQLTGHQRRIFQAVARSRRVAIASCHAIGKSYALACLALTYAVMYEDARVLVITPGWLMNRAIIWAEINSILDRAEHRLPIVSRTATELRLGPKNLVIGLSSADPLRLQGHHSANLLVLCDEVTALDPGFFPSIEGLLPSKLVISGNPTVSSGPLYDAFSRNASLYETIQLGCFDTDNFEGVTLERLLSMSNAELDDNKLPFLITRRWAKERYLEWWNGSVENSPLWASRVLGIFPSSSSNQLIPLHLLEAARRLPPVSASAELIVGIDPAGPGRDLCAAVIATLAGDIVASRTWSDADARGPIIDWLRPYRDRIRLVRYDSSGLGYFFSDPLMQAGYRCDPINVAMASSDPERFANSKAERFWNLRLRFMAGMVSGLNDETLAELAAIQWLVDLKGRTAIEAKESVKASLGHSPDRAESLMICLGESFEPVRMILAPPRPGSISDMSQPAGPRGNDTCVQMDELEDGVFRGADIWLTKSPGETVPASRFSVDYGSISRRRTW